MYLGAALFFIVAAIVVTLIVCLTHRKQI
jgi:hypothetical protein